MIHYGQVEKSLQKFGTSPQTISYHFKNIISEDELEENEVSISSDRLFKENIEFSKEYLQNSKKRRTPSNMV